MKGIVLAKPGNLELIEMPLPPPPGQDEVQVRVHRVGICGTDLHAFAGKQPFFSYPRILGHELAVEILEIGPTRLKHELKIGDRCCVRPYLNCGHCGACRRGRENCCVNLQVIGVHRDGGMREVINVPLDKLYTSAVLADEQLALVEMLSIGAHAVRRMEIVPGEFALVIGVGPIGLGVCQFAQEAGAKVIAMDISESRLAFAAQNLGIEYQVNAQGDITEQLKTIIPDDLPTMVFDATGNAQSMKNSFQYVANGGRLVFVGLFQGEVVFSDPEFHRRELSLFASRNATDKDFKKVIQTLEDGTIDVRPWITNYSSADRICADFPGWLEPSSGVIKAMLTL